MPKLNTKQIFKNLSGGTIYLGNGSSKTQKEPLTLGMVLADILLAPSDETGGIRVPLKAYGLATELYNKRSVEISEYDLNQLKTVVESSKVFIPLIIGQALQMLERTK